MEKLESFWFIDDIIVKLLSLLTRDGTQADSLKSLLTAVDQTDDMAVKYEANELLKTLCNLRKGCIFKVKDIIEEDSMSIYIKPETTDFYEMGYNKCREDIYSKVIPKVYAENYAKAYTKAYIRAKAHDYAYVYAKAYIKAYTESKASGLETLLKLKFGHIDKVYSTKIKSATIKELNKYLKKLTKAKSIDEIFS